MGYVYLAAAIVSEIVATMSLRASDGFSKWQYGVLVVVGYVGAFTFLTMALQRDIPLGVAYAIWGAVGIAVVAVLSVPIFGETLSVVQVGGLALVLAGVVAIEAGGSH